MKIKYNSNFYEFDIYKFLYNLSKGESFYTDYHEVTIKNKNTKVYWQQTLSYQIDDEFIKNNFNKLKKLYILLLVK